MGFIDTFIGAISPAAQLRRETAKAKLAIMNEQLRKYEAASRGRRTNGWVTDNNSINAENYFALPVLRSRSRDLVRNNPWARNAVEIIATNTVGTGIRPAIRGKDVPRYNRLKQAWQRWADSTECDFYGRLNLWGLQHLVMKTVAEAGEVLIVKRYEEGSLKLQVLEPEFLDHTRDGLKMVGGGDIVQGVELDSQGRRVAYWLFENHPQDVRGMTSFASKRVLAKDVLHVFRQERPGQVRGVPFAASSILRLRDLDEYEDAQLVRQKIASCFSVFVRDTSTEGTPNNNGSQLTDRVEPGIIQELLPGQDIAFADPPGVDGYDAYTKSVLRSVAAGFGVSYEALTGDLERVNYSSGRMGWLEFMRKIEHWQLNVMVPQFCFPVWGWFSDFAGIMGMATDVEIDWTPPKRSMVDPTKEVPATINAIRGGLQTQSDALRELGYDPEKVYTEMAEDNKVLDSLGLILDSDARKTMKAGVVQPYVSAELMPREPEPPAE